MGILFETKCSNLDISIASIAVSEICADKFDQNVILQYRFHVSSCYQCYSRAKIFIKKSFDFCQILTWLPFFLSKKELMPQIIMEEFKKSDPLEREFDFDMKGHIENCDMCSYWSDFLINSWEIPSEDIKESTVNLIREYYPDLVDFVGEEDFLGIADDVFSGININSIEEYSLGSNFDFHDLLDCISKLFITIKAVFERLKLIEGKSKDEIIEVIMKDVLSSLEESYLDRLNSDKELERIIKYIVNKNVE